MNCIHPRRLIRIYLRNNLSAVLLQQHRTKFAGMFRKNNKLVYAYLNDAKSYSCYFADCSFFPSVISTSTRTSVDWYVDAVAAASESAVRVAYDCTRIPASDIRSYHIIALAAPNQTKQRRGQIFDPLIRPLIIREKQRSQCVYSLYSSSMQLSVV